jgi:hypothetical protein
VSFETGIALNLHPYHFAALAAGCRHFLRGSGFIAVVFVGVVLQLPRDSSFVSAEDFGDIDDTSSVKTEPFNPISFVLG